MSSIANSMMMLPLFLYAVPMFFAALAGRKHKHGNCKKE